MIPPKGKRIAWTWIKREKQARRVAIAEIRSENKVAYALEIERTNQQHAILVMTRSDWQEIGPRSVRKIDLHRPARDRRQGRALPVIMLLSP
jgi:hypothetical protein